MALKGILRPGFIQLRVLDMDEALTHYIDPRRPQRGQPQRTTAACF